MPIVPVSTSVIVEESVVSLPRYAQIIGLDECALFGVTPSDNYACHKIWTLDERRAVAKYLAEAQAMIESVVGYPLYPKWFTDEYHPFRYPLLTQWSHVIAGGVKGTTVIQAGAAISYVTEPATIGPIATTVTDESELHIFYPVSLVEEQSEIMPSDIDIVGGNVTIYVPRCRMVKPSAINNTDAGLTWSDVPPSVTSPFLTTVDVKRIYNDTSTQATLVWPHRSTSSCSCACGCATCGEYTTAACIYVRDTITGALDILPATYGEGAWTAACPTCYCSEPSGVRVNYYAGLTSLPRDLEDAIVRLAHSLMPFAPCNCEQSDLVWKRDRSIPQILSAERYNCSYGLSDGAWSAWKTSMRHRLLRASVL